MNATGPSDGFVVSGLGAINHGSDEYEPGEAFDEGDEAKGLDVFPRGHDGTLVLRIDWKSRDCLGEKAFLDTFEGVALQPASAAVR